MRGFGRIFCANFMHFCAYIYARMASKTVCKYALVSVHTRIVQIARFQLFVKRWFNEELTHFARYGRDCFTRSDISVQQVSIRAGV